MRAMTPRPAGSRKPPPTAESADTRPALPPASRPTFDLSDQGSSYVGATIRALENRWQNSIVKHNFGVIEELVADDFIGTSSTGRLGSKSTLLSESRHDKNIYSSAVARGMIVRAYGSDVAVATGVTREAGTTPDGRRFTNARRFTDTWMKRNGRWQCVCSNATELPRD